MLYCAVLVVVLVVLVVLSVVLFGRTMYSVLCTVQYCIMQMQMQMLDDDGGNRGSEKVNARDDRRLRQERARNEGKKTRARN